jgi:hypothetical protein
MDYSTVSTGGPGEEVEYDFRSFYWHRYEPRFKPSNTGSTTTLRPNTSQLRARVTDEAMLDPSSDSRMVSRAASPISGPTDAAVVDALSEMSGWRNSQVEDPPYTHAHPAMNTHGESVFTPRFHDSSNRYANPGHAYNETPIQDNGQESNVPWYDIDFNESVFQNNDTDLGHAQWVALDYTAWPGDSTDRQSPFVENISGLLGASSADADAADLAFWLNA